MPYADGIYTLNWSTSFQGWLIERGSTIKVSQGIAYAESSQGVLQERSELLQLIPK